MEINSMWFETWFQSRITCQIQWYLIIGYEPIFVSSCKYLRMKSIENKNCIIRKHNYILNVKDIQNAISVNLRNSYYFPVDVSDFEGKVWMVRRSFSIVFSHSVWQFQPMLSFQECLYSKQPVSCEPCKWWTHLFIDQENIDNIFPLPVRLGKT